MYESRRPTCITSWLFTRLLALIDTYLYDPSKVLKPTQWREEDAAKDDAMIIHAIKKKKPRSFPSQSQRNVEQNTYKTVQMLKLVACRAQVDQGSYMYYFYQNSQRNSLQLNYFFLTARGADIIRIIADMHNVGRHQFNLTTFVRD